MKIINNITYVLNPHTGQPLKIGTKTYRKIVKDRCLNLNYNNRKDYVVFDGSDMGDIDLNAIKNKLKKQPDMIYVIKNRQIWAQRRKLNMTELINYIIGCTVDVLKNNVSLKELLMMKDDDINYILTKEINQKIVGDVSINMDGSSKELFVLDNLNESEESD